jgi:hypothetical protein
MAKTASDPLFGTTIEPLTAARKGVAVTPNDNADLTAGTSSLIGTAGSGGTGIAVLFPDALDSAPVIIPLAPGSYRLPLQVRRVMSTGTVLGTGGGVVATWS